MKPKLTTSTTHLINQVQLELTAPFSDRCTLLFAVKPAVGMGHFSIQLIEEESPFLIVREWRPDRQTSYPTGIFDLNDVYIGERRLVLLHADYAFIQGIKDLDRGVKKSEGIVLDGADYSLIVGDETIRWTLADQLSPELDAALSKLCALAGFEPGYWK